jgi:hypothetical protein
LEVSLSGSGVPIPAIDNNSENLELIAATLVSERLEILTATDPEVDFDTLCNRRQKIAITLAILWT